MARHRVGLPRTICTAIRDHHQPLATPYDQITGLVYYSCRISDALGFSALESPEPPDSSIQEFLGLLPAAQRNRLNINFSELQILIASRVNALEV